MSKLIVEVCEVAEVKPHPNADRLEIALVKAWPIVVQKSMGLKPGDPVVYFPPDTIMTESLADTLGVKKYLAPVGGDRPGFRVRAANLRGQKSYGVLEPSVNGFSVGDDVSKHFGVWKYEPPSRLAGDHSKGGKSSDSLPEIPAFHKYTDIENLRNYPGVIQSGELVVISEKVHGMNVRIGLVRVPDKWTGIGRFEFMAGSHNVRRKNPKSDGPVVKVRQVASRGVVGLLRFVRLWSLLPFSWRGTIGRAAKRNDPIDCKFWNVMTPEVMNCLRELSAGTNDVVIFGELFGSGIQDMHYGFENGRTGFRAFDVSVDGRYLDFDEKLAIFEKHAIPSVPLLYAGQFDMDVIDRFVDGPTMLCDPSIAGKFKGREGIVVTPYKERFDPEIGRVILKSIGADYLSRKEAQDN